MDERLHMHPPGASALARAQALIEVNRYADSLPFLRQALQESPDSLTAMCLLGVALHFTGRSREGLKAAQDAVPLDPDNEWPFRVQASILSGMGRRKQALEAALCAASRSPYDPHVLECLARAQMGCKQWKAAKETAATLLAIAPDWDSTHNLLGDISLATRRSRDAVAHYQETLRLNAQSYAAMNNLGVALQRLNRHKEAIECFHQAARLDPSAKLSRDNLYTAVRGYAGFGFLGLWFLVQAVRIVVAGIEGLPESMRPAAAIAGGLLLLLGLCSAFWIWRRRVNELHPTVMTFFREEQRRTSRSSLNRIATAVLLVLGAGTTVYWSAFAVRVGARESGLTSWPLALYVLISGGTIAAIGYLLRNRRRSTRL